LGRAFDINSPVESVPPIGRLPCDSTELAERYQNSISDLQNTEADDSI